MSSHKQEKLLNKEKNMSFDAEKSNLNKILSRNYSYIIPLNQRKYVWTNREWNELFEDVFLIEQKDGYTHFLGALVLEKGINNYSYKIIDGQQRLITVCILFCCIINKLREIQEHTLADSLLSLYLKGSHDGNDFLKISRSDENFFLTQLIDTLHKPKTIQDIKREFDIAFRKTDKYNSQLLLCYEYFDDKLTARLNSTSNQKEYLILLKNKLIDCEVIEITVTNDYDGYKIFETLNARGIPLEQHELIKNYIYSYLRTTALREKVTNSWGIIVSNLVTGSNDFLPLFLSHYCTHRFGKTKKSEEFRTIRANTEKTRVNLLLESLVKTSEYYKYIESPERYKLLNDHSAIIYESLRFFKIFNIRQVRPLLLSLFEKLYSRSNRNKIEKVFKFLEKFYFLYVIISKNTTNTIDKTINDLARDVHSAKIDNLDEIKDSLKKFIDSDVSIFKNDFIKIGYSNKNRKYRNSNNKKLVNYIFSEFEKHLDNFNENNFIIKSIEHIMNDSETDDSTSKIGNLLPMSEKLNQKIGNADFKNKLSYYEKSNLRSVKKFYNENKSKNEWGREEIDNRTKELANIAIDHIWKI